MSRSKLRTVLLEGRQGPRDWLTQLLSSRPGELVVCAGVSQTLAELRGEGADLLLVPACRSGCQGMLQEAEVAGLDIRLLFEPAGREQWRYLARCRFGSHKWAFQLLEGCGTWWELRREESEPYDRYRKLLNRVADGVVEVDGQDCIRWANDTLRQALHNGDLEGLSLADLVEAADMGQLRALREQHAAGMVVPFPVRLATGQVVQMDPSPRFSRSGQSLGSSIVFRGVGREAIDIERSRELFALYSVATAVSQAIGLEAAMRAVVMQVPEMLGLSGAGIFLQEPPGLMLRALHGVEPDDDVLDLIEAYCCAVPPGKKAAVVRHLASEADDPVRRLLEHGYNGIAAVPLRRTGEQLGVAWFVAREEGKFSREMVSLLISVGYQTSVAVQNARHVENQLFQEHERRCFYRDALQAVTRGKLRLCERPELEEVWTESGEQLGRIVVESQADVPRARNLVEEVLTAQTVTPERCHDLALCTTEAVGNVVKHAEGGAVEIRGNAEVIRIRVEDDGPGIDFAQLPKAVLSAGFSTAPSLGMGYSILLELVDALHLTTGEGGTVLLLELARQEPDPLAAFAHLLDE